MSCIHDMMMVNCGVLFGCVQQVTIMVTSWGVPCKTILQIRVLFTSVEWLVYCMGYDIFTSYIGHYWCPQVTSYVCLIPK